MLCFPVIFWSLFNAGRHTTCLRGGWKHAADSGEDPRREREREGERERERERERARGKLEGMGPRLPVVGLTFEEKWAIFSVSMIEKKEGVGTVKIGLQTWW